MPEIPEPQVGHDLIVDEFRIGEGDAGDLSRRKRGDRLRARTDRDIRVVAALEAGTG